MFGRVLALGVVLLAVVSLGSPMGLLAHTVLLMPLAGLLWVLQVIHRPVRPCLYCDSGKDWDGQREHYGRHCAGGPLGLGSCGGTGEKLRWEARALKVIGAGHLLRNLPAHLREEDD